VPTGLTWAGMGWAFLVSKYLALLYLNLNLGTERAGAPQDRKIKSVEMIVSQASLY